MDAKDDQTLKMFSAAVAKLRKSPLNKSGTFKLTVRVMRRDDSEPAFEGLPEEDVERFLLPLRQLTMAKESIQFEKVCKIVEDHCPRPELLEWTAWLRSQWNSVLDGAPIGLKVGDRQIRTREALNYYLYSGLFHSDAKKTEFMDSLSDGARGTIEMFVHRCLHDLFDLAHRLDCVTWHWLVEPAAEVVPAPKP